MSGSEGRETKIDKIVRHVGIAGQYSLEVWVTYWHGPNPADADAKSVSSCADPTCSIDRDPRREDHTICTAVAPDVVFTVRKVGHHRTLTRAP